MRSETRDRMRHQLSVTSTNKSARHKYSYNKTKKTRHKWTSGHQKELPTTQATSSEYHTQGKELEFEVRNPVYVERKAERDYTPGAEGKRSEVEKRRRVQE